MSKARIVRLALMRHFAAFAERGPRVTLEVPGVGHVTFACHDRVELADRRLTKAARQFGLTWTS